MHLTCSYKCINNALMFKKKLDTNIWNDFGKKWKIYIKYKLKIAVDGGQSLHEWVIESLIQLIP